MDKNSNSYGCHATHCCSIHGCKYGDRDCPAANGEIKGVSCEDCGLEREGYYDRTKYYTLPDYQTKEVNVKVKKLHKDAVIPKYQISFSAGFDLHAVVNEENCNGYEVTHKDGKVVHIFKRAKPLLWEKDEESIIPVQIIPSGERMLISTGLAVSIPEGYELQIRPRSGLALKKGITVLNSPGTVDPSYLDCIGIIIINLSNDECPFVVKNGDRVAQGVLGQVPKAVFEEVEDFDDDTLKTDRGGGFGSTGIK